VGTYFLAVRTYDGSLGGLGLYGKWSNEVECKKP